MPRKLSKRLRAEWDKIDSRKVYPLDEAIATVKSAASAKFNETVDLAFKIGVDPKQADQMVRGTVSLPHGLGKTVRVVVFAKGEQAAKAKAAGADEVGDADLVEKVQGGWTDFDAAVATPDMMRDVGKLGRILGPRGLMPTPKAGTVTPDVEKAVTEIKAGKIEYKVDKNANIHVPIGKVSFQDQQLVENASTAIEAIIRAKPAAAKGTYLKAVAISSTMGPGVKLDTAILMKEFK